MSVIIPIVAADGAQSTVTLAAPIVVTGTGTTYFVAAAGNDNNSGTSSSAPWATVARVNAQTFKLGDTVLFNCGDTFYGRLVCQQGLTANGTSWVTYGNYGTGQLPIISQYKVCNIASGWSLYSTNIWKLNYSAANVGVTYTGDPTGNLGQYGYDVGFIKTGGANDNGLARHGTIWNQKQNSIAACVNQWDYYSDYANGILYVYSVGRPTTVASDIRIATGGWSAFDSLTIGNGIRVNGLTFMGNGGHCISDSVGNYWQLLNSCLCEIGGSLLYGTVSYGNAITLSDGTANFLGTGNVIRDVYNSAYGTQEDGPYTNCTWTNNLIWRAVQITEYDCRSGGGNGLTNCLEQYNTYLYNGWYSPFAQGNQLPVQNPCAQLTYQWTCTTPQLQIKNNSYYEAGPYFSYSYSLDNSSPIPGGYSSKNNYIALRPGTRMQSPDNDPSGGTTIDNNPSGWTAATTACSGGRELGSTFKVLNNTVPASGAVATDAQVWAAIAACRTASPTTGIAGGGRPDPVYPG